MSTRDEAVRLVQVIREAVTSHEEDGPAQWYVDEFTVDCDAERFWQIVEQALRKVADEPAEARRSVARELLAADDAYPADDAGMAYDNLLGIMRRMAGDV